MRKGAKRMKAKSVIECRHYYLPSHFPLIALQGDYWRISDQKSERLHFHNCLEIGLCHSDTGRMEFYERSLPFEAGDMTVVPRNVPHTTYSSSGTKSRWSYLFFDPKGLLGPYLPAGWTNFDLLSYHFPNYRYLFKKEDYPEMHALLTLIFRELSGEEEGQRQAVTGLILALFLQIYRAQNRLNHQQPEGEGPADEALIRKTVEIAPALEFIEEHYDEAFTVDDLAAICSWSPTHFRRLFTETMGLAPLDYINNTRIMKSCYALCSSDKNIGEIAEAVGFGSVSAYNRNFRRVFDLSPSEYRKNARRFEKTELKPEIREYPGWMRPE